MWGSLLLLLLVAGCRVAEQGGLVVESAWGRPSPQGAPAAAFYMTIVNHSGRQDAIQAVHSEACAALELHRSAMDEEGVMRMAPVPGGKIDVASGESVRLEPGGLHIMCVGPPQPFAAGQEVLLTLDFEVAGSIDVAAEIRPEAP